MNNRDNFKIKKVILRSNLETVPNIYALKRIGVGHDGAVYRYGDKVLKLLKYDIDYRKENGLMYFEKMLYFQNELQVKRITKPTDILIDSDGIYTGYVMDYVQDITDEKLKGTPIYKSRGSFTCGDLITSALELEEDFKELTNKHVLARDINRGSYICSFDFIHMCDMDKFRIANDATSVNDLNRRSLNFFIAKFLFYEMQKENQLDKQQLKQLNQWVKKSSNSRSFLNEIMRDIQTDYECPISEYTSTKVKKLIR